MEDSLKLKTWILSQKSTEIKIKELTWVKKFNLPLYDYMVEVFYDNKLHVGRGTDEVEDVAICKAFGEAFERYCVKKLKLPNTNGCAVHFDENVCKSKALDELIERDCFLYKFILGQAFQPTGHRYFNISLPATTKLTNYLLLNSAYAITLTRIHVNDESNIFGLGISKEIDSAIRTSEIEALRQWAYIFDANNHMTRTYGQIMDSKIKSFDDHGDLALTKEHYNSISSLFSSQNYETTYSIPPINDINYFVTYSENDSKSPFFKIPLFFVKAQCEYLQELFIGETVENINKKRIVFASYDDLNLCIHPIR